MLSYLEKVNEASIRWIEQTLASEPDISRTRLAREFCRQFDWVSPYNRPRQTGSFLALNRLEKYGLVSLPTPGKIACNDPARRNEPEPFPARPELSCTLAELGEISLTMVNGDKELWSLWQSMINSWHPLKNSNLCGARICYLIKSSTAGLLGAISFSSAAWKLADREAWIGWSDTTRAQNLTRVINNSRFLILPQVRVPHLASHVLARACRRVAEDWQVMYGIRPILLETFVDPARYRGTCYRAAGWLHIGRTSGRGRQDTGDGSGVKEIFCLPLDKDFRRILGGREPKPRNWTDEEFSGVQLGDQRLNRRLVQLAQDFYENPLASIPQACGSRAATKGAYRFFRHPAVTLEEILSGHYQATAKRIQEHKGVILAAQDTTSLNFSPHPATKGLGPIDARGTQGLLLHDTMAFTGEGVPLGLINVQYWAREEKKNRTVAESVKWLESFRATDEISRRYPGRQIVSVGDREADFFDLFTRVRPDGAQLLVRATHCRSLVGSDANIWIHMQRCSPAGTLDIQAPARPGKPGRVARLAVSFDRVALRPPASRKDLEPVEMWAVLAREEDPPSGGEPLEWLLLTTVEVRDFEGACERIAWYTRRWGIEVFHRVLKSGCKTEDRQLGTSDRLGACLALDMIVAWRVYYLTMLGRETPDLPCTVFFEESEWKVLTAHAARSPIPSPKPPTLYEALILVARLGGYIEKSKSKPPGTTTVWRGLVALGWITDAWRAFAGNHGPPDKPD